MGQCLRGLMMTTLVIYSNELRSQGKPQNYSFGLSVIKVQDLLLQSVTLAFLHILDVQSSSFSQGDLHTIKSPEVWDFPILSRLSSQR